MGKMFDQSLNAFSVARKTLATPRSYGQTIYVAFWAIICSIPERIKNNPLTLKIIIHCNGSNRWHLLCDILRLICYFSILDNNTANRCNNYLSGSPSLKGESERAIQRNIHGLKSMVMWRSIRILSESEVL